MKVISFSLWGDKPIYNIGAIENVKLGHKYFPDWRYRFYTGTNTDRKTIDILRKYENVDIIETHELGTMKSMVWRFLACSDSNVNVMLSRDTDCRLSLREKEAVDLWLNSEKDFHIIRDHPHHNISILGGLWGARNGILKDMDKMLKDFEAHRVPDEVQYDQTFLTRFIYNIVKDKAFINDAFFDKINILNTPRLHGDVYFLGEIFNHDNTHYSQQHREMIEAHK